MERGPWGKTLSPSLQLTERDAMISSRLTRSSKTICPWQMRRCRLLSGGKTYYDSQSGMHVPLHDENEISTYLHLDGDKWLVTDGIRKKVESLLEAREVGFVGVRLRGHIDKQALLMEQLSEFAPGFTLFYGSHRVQKVPYPDNVNLLFEYKDSFIQQHLSAHVANGSKTSIGLFEPTYYARDPILVANGVASLMDKTGGGDFVWLTPNKPVDENEKEVDDDEMIRLCEELSYLDVPGSTMKSRLVVEAKTEDQVEECLNMGLNKFVLHSPGRVEWLRGIVEEQGKNLARG